MSNHTNDVEQVTDVIQVMKSGVDFYKDALAEVHNQHVKSVFSKTIARKEAAIKSLQPLAVAEQSERETGSSFAVESRKMYTKFISMLSSDEDFTYVKQLEEVEDKVLQALDDALDQDQPAPVMSVLSTVRADAQVSHDEMKALQEQLKS